jgi:hypothetical protein
MLEVTEGVLDRPSVTERLVRLREAGVRISLDDFGSGPIVLARMRELPLDVIKVDQTLVAALDPQDPGRRAHRRHPTARLAARVCRSRSKGSRRRCSSTAAGNRRSRSRRGSTSVVRARRRSWSSGCGRAVRSSAVRPPELTVVGAQNCCAVAELTGVAAIGSPLGGQRARGQHCDRRGARPGVPGDAPNVTVIVRLEGSHAASSRGREALSTLRVAAVPGATDLERAEPARPAGTPRLTVIALGLPANENVIPVAVWVRRSPLEEKPLQIEVGSRTSENVSTI